MKAIEDCTDAEDVMKCVEEVLLGVSDCVVSISFKKKLCIIYKEIFKRKLENS